MRAADGVGAAACMRPRRGFTHLIGLLQVTCGRTPFRNLGTV